MGPTAIVLAAGRSTRMQERNKLLLPWGEKRIVEVVVETLAGAPLTEVVVVTGHQHAAVEEALRDCAVRLVHNPHYAEGLSTSIRAGVEAAQGSSGYLFVLGDMPRLKRETVVRLCDVFLEHEDAIVVPTVAGRQGNPVAFSRWYREELLRLEGDRGAKSLLREYADRVVAVVVEDDGIFVDVDTPEAYQKAVEEGDGEVAMPDRDHCGNEWRITASGELEVVAPGAAGVVVWDQPGSTAQSVATDDHGFVWLVAGATVYFSNPRAIADTETPDASAQQPGSAGIFTAVEPELLPGTPTRLQRSDAGMMLVHCTSEGGAESVVELEVEGRDIGGPFTSGHTAEVMASLELTPANADWEVLPARLPCGTHDNHCTTANGRVFVVGGATHYRGFPAVAHVHDELLAYDPAYADAGWAVVGRLPEGCVYSAMAALDGRVYVIGSGGGGGPVRAECWSFNAASTCEATADRQAAPSLPSPRLGCVAATANGRIWLVGGTGGETGFGSEQLCELLSISPGETEWRIEPPAPAELPVATLAGCEFDGVFYVLGGAPARFLAFDTASGTWDESLPNHPLGSQAAAMAAHEGEIWVCGGGVIIDSEINPDGRGEKRVYSQRSHSFSVAERRWVERPEMPFEQNWGAACSLAGRLLLIAGAHRSQSAGAYVFDNRVLALR